MYRFNSGVVICAARYTPKNGFRCNSHRASASLPPHNTRTPDNIDSPTPASAQERLTLDIVVESVLRTI
jgi:hypothetical protein